MEEINSLVNKYRYARLDIEYKYIANTIKELSTDLQKITKIETENKSEKKVCDLCVSIKEKLNYHKSFLTNKLANIPNVKYLEESDEEFVDKYM